MTTDLVPGEEFRDYLFSRSNVEQKKGNGPDIKLTLAFNYRHYLACKWKVSEEEKSVLLNSQFLVLTGSVNKGGDYPDEIIITKLRGALAEETPSDHSPYLKPVHDNHQIHLTRFDHLVALVTDPHLSQLLEKVFDKSGKRWQEFCQACAAEKMHHNYRGGLLHHTVEVAELCAHVCEVIPELSRDLLIASALLHDIGKLEELEHGLNAGAYTNAGILSGHIMYGVINIRPYMKQDCIPGFPRELREAVTHMILSHHGTREFGSPQVPSFPEAHVLSECDMISARVFQYRDAISKKKDWLPGKDGIRIFAGDLGLQKLPEVVRETTITYVTQPREIPTFQTTKLRIRGLVAAGAPEQGSMEEEETREVVLPTCGADFLVRVTGDSMADEGIREHDVLFVKEIESPRNGDIVIAHIGATGEVVKRYRSDSATGLDMGAQWLESENSSRNYPNIPVDSETRTRGKVVGLLRDF